jgi:hypothetical protein
MALGSTELLTGISIRNLPREKGRPTLEADNFTSICELIFLQNVEASMYHIPMDLHGLLQGYLYPFVPVPTFRDITLRSPRRSTDVSKEYVASILRILRVEK